ncbi:hypothetical protein ABT391_37525, partial [Streptomyces jumonjinensis]
RCAHQWPEPELTRADFDVMTGGSTTGPVYPSLEDAARATGFDGAFTGMYLNEPRPQGWDVSGILCKSVGVIGC